MQEPILVDTDAAAVAVRPYTWLLNQIGDDGITLTEAGYLPPAQVAAGITDGHDQIVADLLDAIGWMRGDGTPLTVGSVARAALDIKDTLRRMGLLHHRRGLDRDDHLTRQGVTFARAALTTWQ